MRTVEGLLRSNARLGISIERGTAAVPSDGRFHVVVDGVVVFSTRVEAAAVAEYDEIHAARKQGVTEQLRRERAAADIHAHRASAWASKTARDARKGGRGVGRK